MSCLVGYAFERFKLGQHGLGWFVMVWFGAILSSTVTVVELVRIISSRFSSITVGRLGGWAVGRCVALLPESKANFVELKLGLSYTMILKFNSGA